MHIILIILLIILLLLVLLLLSCAVVEVEYWNGEFRYDVRYFGIQVYPFRKKLETEQTPDELAKEAQREQKKAAKKAEKDAKKKAEKAAAKAERKKLLIAEKIRNAFQLLAERADLAGDILSAVPGPLRKLLHSITLGDLTIDFLVANEDAADCAIMYGRMQLLVQNLLANLGKHIHVKRKKVRIACDFAADESRWNIRFRLQLQIGTAVAAALWFLWKFWWGGKKADRAIADPVI